MNEDDGPQRGRRRHPVGRRRQGQAGRLADRHAQGVVRFQGGHNAGHTLVINGVKTALHLIPSGIMRAGRRSATSATAWCCRPAKLLEEIEGLEKAGVEVRSRLRISEACPLILPFHAALDIAREALREQGGTEKIGTTGRGIGPAYEDKIARRALRVQDLKHPERFAEKLQASCSSCTTSCSRSTCTRRPLDFQPMLDEALQLAEQLRADDGRRLARAERGAPARRQPAVRRRAGHAAGRRPRHLSRTSPPATASPAMPSAGAGVGPGMLHYILGITKAYCTRVGGGPFPTELRLGDAGHRGLPPVARSAPRRACTTGPLAPLRLVRRGAAQAQRAGQRPVGPVHHQARRARRPARSCSCAPATSSTASTPTSCRWAPTRSRAASRSTRRMPGWSESTVGVTEYDKLPVNARLLPAAHRAGDRRADRYRLDQPGPRPHDHDAPPLPGADEARGSTSRC